MAERDRFRLSPVLGALAAFAAFLLAAGVVLWWLLWREEPAPPEPPPIEVEAEGPEDEPIVVPAPAEAEREPVVRVGVREVEARVEARLAAALPTTPLTGPVRVRLQDVVWSDPEERPFFEADAILAVLDGGALTGGDVLVAEATLSEPVLRLVRERGADRWNYERALAALLDRDAEDAPGVDDGGPPGPVVRLRDVEVEDGRVVVDPPGPDVYRFLDVDAVVPRAALSVPGEPPRIEVARLSATAVLPEPDRRLAVVVRSVEARFGEPALAFDVERIEVDGTVVTGVTALYEPDAPGLGLEAAARVERLAFDAVRLLLPELPPGGAAEFRISLEPQPDGPATVVRITELAARADESMIAGAASFAVGPDVGIRPLSVDLRLEPLTIATLERFIGPLPYAGALRGTVRGEAPRFAFDVTGLLTAPEVPEPFEARLVGAVDLGEDGIALQAADVELRDVPLAVIRPLVPGLPLAFEGRVTGRIAFEGPPGRAPLRLDVRLGFASGTLVVSGTLDLSGPVPAYDLTGRIVGVSLPALLEPEVPPVALTARFSLVGRGTDPATANARLALSGGFTGWRTGPADTILVRAAVADGTLRLDAAALRLATLTVAAEGTWRFVEAGRGELAYRVELDPVDPFTPYLPRLAAADASGSLATAGTLSGTLARPRFAGDLSGAGLEYGAWAAAELEAEYALALGEPLPGIDVELVARDLIAPDDAVYRVATASLFLDEPELRVEIDAERADGGVFELAADGRVEAEGAIEADVRRFIVDLDAERWALVRTARVTWTPDEGAIVDGLVMREVDGEGRLAVDGRVPPTAEAELRVEIADLPVGQVQALLGVEPIVTGSLWLEARAIGPPEAPRVGVDFRLEGGGFGEVYTTRVVGALLYEDRRLTAEATAVLDTLGTVELGASLPLALELTVLPSIAWLGDRPLRATLEADSLPLAAVTMLSPELRDAEGLLRARALVSGTPEQPRLDGAIQVWNGAVTVPALDQRFEEIRAEILLEDQLAIVREARARSDGWAVARGTVAFPTLTEPEVDLAVEFDEFRAIGAEDREGAAAWGTLRITGDLRAPVVSGDVALDDGDIPVPSFDGGIDEDLVDVEAPPPEAAAEPDAAEPAPWFDRVVLDEVIVDVGDDVWFATEEARAQLTGEVVLVKDVGESIRIFGELEGERGTFILRAGPVVRRFDIVSARIRFFGTAPPNPALDIVASRTIPTADGEPVEVRLVLGGTLDAPTVAVTSAEGANIPESELLSFLLFGQPSFALADGGPGEPLLEEAVFGVGSLAEIASIELEEALIADLGIPLDYFRIQPAPGPIAGFGAPAVAFGRELADDVFLTVNAELAGVFGTAVGPDTWSAVIHWRIDPEWRLELGIAPVYRLREFPWLGARFPLADPRQQFFIELVRRWTY